ncbi:alpha-glucosidase [Paenibacillus caseinilyticus]|uniref:oligo-1,6-glucosidase n=1 Tax=Paenibacillus mucilaginosus K02 TaxID=997761 RepID=I0BU12_9BACL|nr:alpha-glucosidase [Paenibacillus mucilaginosus]AFH65859.1 oligo-1,6-glucosidase [Paenibacillus mucilaginosus K02]
MERRWWKESVVYQVYPRSFMDSNGDGIGDLRGLVDRLDYIRELGADVIWLSPIYQSPNKDNGYDISDYFSIMQDFGTMEDWELLVEEIHDRGMKLMMDLVMNHTSDEHPWFVESRRSKDNPYRDFYIWRPPGRDGGPPNNWASMFGGSAWEYCEETGEYYLHLFSKHQPDLNWDNPRVRRTLYDMVWWWINKGVDGFRMDVINSISKDQSFPSAGEGELANGKQYYENGPHVHEYLQEMNREVLSRFDLMTVGETGGATTEDALRYACSEEKELQMIFHFEHVRLDYGEDKWSVVPWKLKDLIDVLSRWQKELEGKAWNSLYFNNHDQPRSVSRFGHDKEFRVPSAKLLATMLHMLQGTPYIYQGEEIGMTNVRFPSIEDYRDISTLQFYKEQVEEKGRDPQDVLEVIYKRGRDNARTPMQWNAAEHAGFTTGTPWIQVHPNYTMVNVEAERSDPNSVFHYYRRLISLRKKHPIVVYGSYELVPTDGEQLFVYRRKLKRQRLVVILNVSDRPAVYHWSEDWSMAEGRLLISNYPPLEGYGSGGAAKEMKLRPYEARVYGYGL